MHTFADKTPFHAIGRIVQEEGVVKGLYRGLTLNYIKTVPNVAIYMSLYDVCKNFLIARAQKVWCGVGMFVVLLWCFLPLLSCLWVFAPPAPLQVPPIYDDVCKCFVCVRMMCDIHICLYCTDFCTAIRGCALRGEASWCWCFACAAGRGRKSSLCHIPISRAETGALFACMHAFKVSPHVLHVSSSSNACTNSK